MRALQQLVALSVSDQRQRVAPAGPGSRRPINPAGPGPAAPPGGARILTQPIPGGWADPARGPRATLWPGRRSNGTPHRLDQSFGGSESDGRAPGRRGGKAWVARRDHLPRPQSTPRWTLFPNGMKFGPTCVQLFGSRMGQTLHRLDQSSGSCPESDWAGDQALGHPMRPLRSPPQPIGPIPCWAPFPKRGQVLRKPIPERAAQIHFKSCIQCEPNPFFLT